MKTVKLYSIYDTVADRFNAPFIASNDAMAQKLFKDGMKKSGLFGKFELYEISMDIAEPSCKDDVGDNCIKIDTFEYLEPTLDFDNGLHVVGDTDKKEEK